MLQNITVILLLICCVGVVLSMPPNLKKADSWTINNIFSSGVLTEAEYNRQMLRRRTTIKPPFGNWGPTTLGNMIDVPFNDRLEKCQPGELNDSKGLCRPIW